MVQRYSLEELANHCDAEIVGDKTVTISGVCSLGEATPSDISFLANDRYSDAMRTTKAAAICVAPLESYPEGKNFLVSSDPSRVFQKIAELVMQDRGPTAFQGIHPTAVIHETASVDPTAQIGPYCVIDGEVTIGANTQILSHTVIGPRSNVGSDCMIYQNVAIREDTSIGDRVTIQPGAVIGSCGFGFTTGKDGKHTPLSQIGSVRIEDDAAIGANTAIDRARFETTTIGNNTQIDNLVQIGHNVSIGKQTIVVSQSGIAGSTTIGNQVILGGQSGIVGHVKICDGAIITSRGGVSKSIEKPGIYRGEPVEPIGEFSKTKVHIRRLGTYAEKIKALEEKLKMLEEEHLPLAEK